MRRKPRQEEAELVLKLVGSQFSEIDIIKDQLETCLVENGSDGWSLEFYCLIGHELKTPEKILGEGSIWARDNIPIILTLFQKQGYIWLLEIGRADGSPITDTIDFSTVKALGHGYGLSLEYPKK